MTMHHQRHRTTTALQGLGMTAAAALLLTGCVSVSFGGDGEPEDATEATAGGEVSMGPALGPTSLSTEQLGEVPLPAGAGFPGGLATDRSDTVASDAPFTMSLDLTGFTPEGRCLELFERINGFSAPGSTAVASTYELDPAASMTAGQAPTLEVLAATTPEPLDAMGVYGQLPQACGTIESDHGPGARAVFAPVPGLDATTVTISAGDTEQVVVVGGASTGRNHLYLIATMLPAEDAQAVLQAQAERFEAVLAEAGTSGTTAGQEPAAGGE